MTVHPGERRESVEAPVGPLTGTTLDGRYVVENLLGEGGMGVVYAAHHVHLEKRLAIKVLRQDASRDPDLVDRFQREARAATAIGSDHIVDISDFGKTPDGSTYFVMEYLAGTSLADALAPGPMSLPRVLHVGKQICEALGAAHQRGIVHRDLKPDNIYLVRRGGDSNFVKVLDFGIAKFGKGGKRLTVVGQVFGTPHYMSPEQAAGEAVDGRSDVYALGVILYEMTTGKVPFDSEQPMAILTKHLYQEPVPPRQTEGGAEVPPRLEMLILRCLAKRPEDRYSTMEDVAIELESLEYDLPTGVRASFSRLTDSQSEFRLPADGGSGGFRVPRLDALSQSSERDVARRLSPAGGIPVPGDFAVGSEPGASALAAAAHVNTGVQVRLARDADLELGLVRRPSPWRLVLALVAAVALVGTGVVAAMVFGGAGGGATPAAAPVSASSPPPGAPSEPAVTGPAAVAPEPPRPAVEPSPPAALPAPVPPPAPQPAVEATPAPSPVAASPEAPAAAAEPPVAPAAAEAEEPTEPSGARRGDRSRRHRPGRPAPAAAPAATPRRPAAPAARPPSGGPDRRLRDPWAH